MASIAISAAVSAGSLGRLGVPGQFNFDMSGNVDAASMRADITVPLN